ncbi:nucleotidyl transferase [Candidatus Marinamargulisbacteria bacterium SCGC AG-410-N11]|nr:nucleotidyl transferase [Candidatus Marinamargulisbacteria bacterium SCGC AG-410-N11]
MKNNIQNLIKNNTTIKQALKTLDSTAEKIILVVNENTDFLGTLTDGDIRRALLKDASLETSIEGIFNKSFIYLNEDEFTKEKAIEMCKENKIIGLPILNNKKIVSYYSYYNEHNISQKTKKNLSLPVVIMGGGKGTRMKPISDVFPKPLIPLNGKPMINHVIDYFTEYGIDNYFLTLNYKSNLMISYFDSLDKSYSINFAIEPFFMGTAGSIKLLEDKLPNEFIISNCDCIAKTNLSDIIHQHQEKKTLLTVVCSIQHHQIPYGKINYKNGGAITSIEEKPELSMPINTGVYIANKKVLDYIETDKVFHMTHLIEKLIENNLPVHCFFINEKEFIDFGQWKEYERALDLIK